MRKPRYSVIRNIEVGGNTRIYDQVNLYKCRIGKNCKIDAFVYIEGGVEIGNNVKIRAFTFIPEGVKIEDDVYIGPRVTFTNDKYPRARGRWRLLKTLVKKGASIGTGSIILPGVTIGKYALVGAGSLVAKDVGDYAIAQGIPAKVVGHVTDEKFKSKIKLFLEEAPGELRGEDAEWPWP
jgi:acetyltransferase-like isoleucine patch superfamily enzyme